MARRPRRRRGTPAQFRLDVDRWARQAKGDLDEFRTEFPQEVMRQIVENTPVRTGFLRSSWYTQWSGPVFRMINSAHYAIFVEFGTSKMAARAFVRSVLDRANLIARDVLARIRS